MIARVLLLVVALSGGATQAAGESMCKPTLVIHDVKFSDVELDQHTWSARIAVDAAHCATASGRFNIRFVRLKENAPDESFREQFSWAPGENEVSMLFAADEVVIKYAIEALSCQCRR